MDSNLSRSDVQTNNEMGPKQDPKTILSSSVIAAPVTSDKIQDNKKQDVPECIMLDESNLSLNILDELGNSNVSDSSIDLQLRFQRLLAESALENSILDTSKNQPSVSRSEFTFGTSTPHLNKSSSSIYSESNKVPHDVWAEMFKKYRWQDFISGDDHDEVMARLMADEDACKKEFGSSPPVSEKVELSCFSGIMGDAELSLRSIAGPESGAKNKVTAEEYFSLKTDKMGSLDKLLNNKDRPNFGNEIQSPSVSRARVAFVNESTNDVPEKLDETHDISNISKAEDNIVSETHDKVIDLNSTPKSCSSLSISSIEDILSKHLQDTPGTIARSILNPKGKTKSAMNQDSSLFTVSGHTSALSENQMDRMSSELADWIQVEMSQKEEYETYIGSSMKAAFQLQSQSTRWLKCSFSIHKIVHNKTIDNAIEKEMSSIIKLPDVTLVGPGQKTVQKVVVTPTVPGNFGIYVNINTEDAVTQTSKNYIVKFDMVSKIPQVEVFLDSAAVGEVDFGTLPECCCQLTNLKIKNYSDDSLPLSLNIEEVSNTYRTFSLGKNEDDASKSKADEENCLKVSVVFKAPTIKHRQDTRDGFIHFVAYLNISALVSPEAKPCLLKKLKLKGSVGITQLLLNFTSPVELSSSGPGVPSAKTLSLKNGGVVPLNLKLLVIDPKTWQLEANSVVTVSNQTLHIPPGNETAVNLIFTPTWMYEESIKRKLVIHVTPDGNLFEVDIQASVTDNKKDENKTLTDTSQSTGFGSSTSTSITGIPVQTTHKQLVWNTVPVGKSEMQSCRLRNDWPTAVKVLLSLVDSGHGFWLLNENGEHVVERKMRLHAKECVPVNVIFCPSKVGVAYGKIVIRESKRTASAERFAIPLSGYCGTFNLSIRNIPKDKSGNMWINLGPLDSHLHTHFTVINKGNLESFVYVKYVPKGVGALLQGVKVSIEPSKTVIAPGSNETIKVAFALQNDLSFISKDSREVLELGNLYVTCGDEATRQRIRRIKEKMRGKATMSKILNLEDVCSTFPGETSISDLSILNEPESALRYLCRTFQQHEISLTVEVLDDRSLAMQTCVGGSLENQSLVFRSMLPDATFSASIEDSGRDVASWSITPSNLTLLVPKFASGCITIASTHKEDQIFEICCTEDFLSVDPSSGIIPGHGEVVAVVTCNIVATSCVGSTKSTLKVLLENDMKTVTVHIKPIQENLTQRFLLSNNSENTQKTNRTSAKVVKNEANKKKSFIAPRVLDT